VGIGTQDKDEGLGGKIYKPSPDTGRYVDNEKVENTVTLSLLMQ